MTRVINASLAVAGQSLTDESLAMLVASAHDIVARSFVWQLLTLATDAKGDNLIVTDLLELVSVDHDLVGLPPYTKQLDGQHRLNLRSLVACSTPALSKPLSAELMREFAALIPAVVLLQLSSGFATLSGK